MWTSALTNQIATSSRSRSVSCIYSTETSLSRRNWWHHNQPANLGRACGVESQAPVARRSSAQSRQPSMSTFLPKRSIHQWGSIWDFQVTPLPLDPSHSFQWLRWATTRLPLLHAVLGSLSTKLCSSTTPVILQSSLKSCKTQVALTSHSHLLARCQVNRFLLWRSSSIHRHQGFTTSVPSLYSTTPLLTSSPASCKVTATDHRSACHRRNYFIHPPSLVCQQNKNSWWKMNQESPLSTSGESLTNTKTRSVSCQTKQSCNRMRKLNLSPALHPSKRKNIRSMCLYLCATCSIRSKAP